MRGCKALFAAGWQRGKFVLAASFFLGSLSVGLFPAVVQAAPDQFDPLGLMTGVPMSGSSYVPEVVDVNGDGNLDVMTVDATDAIVGSFRPAYVTARLGNGDGTFGSPITSDFNKFVIGAGAGVRFGDFTGDGKVDVLKVRYGSNPTIFVDIHAGDNSGSFNPTATLTSTLSGQVNRYYVTDIEGDGDKDIVGYLDRNVPGGLINSPSAVTFINNGSGSFTGAGPAGLPPTAGSSSYDITAVGDVTGDGKADLLVGITQVHGVVMAGNGTGGYIQVPGPNLAGLMTGFWAKPEIADFTGDGLADIVVHSQDSGSSSWVTQGIRVYKNLGGGSFDPDFPPNNTRTIFSSPLINASEMKAADINHDNKIDLITANFDQVAVYVNDGTGKLTGVQTQTPGGRRMNYLATGDVDDDGNNDLVVGSVANDNIGTTSPTAPRFALNINQPADSIAPNVTGVPDRAANGAGWYDANVTIDWQATDPAPSSGTPTDPVNTVASQEGVHTYTSAQSCDPANNCATGSLQLKIDKTDPQIAGFATVTPNPQVTGSDVTLTVGAEDTVSGISDGEYYLGSEDPGEGEATPMTWNGSQLAATFGANLPPQQDVYVVHMRARDNAGNWSSVLERTFRIDNDGTTVVSGQVTGLGNQPVAGTLVEVRELGGSTVVGSDTTDPAGNYAISVDAATYDMYVKPPTGSGYADIGLGLVDLRYADKVQDFALGLGQVTGLTAESPTNDPPQLHWDTHPLATYYEVQRPGPGALGSTTTTTFTHATAPANSTQTYQVRPCTPVVCGPWSENLVVMYDTQPPQLNTPRLTTPIPVGTTSGLEVDWVDSLSQVTEAEYFIGSDPGQGNGVAMEVGHQPDVLHAQVGEGLGVGVYTIHVRAKDAAGNWSSTVEATLTVQDVTPPAVTALLSAQPNANGWYKANVTIDWQSVDPAPSSGTPTDPPNTVASTQGENVTYTSAQSCDPAGNCATGEVQLSIDKTVPTVATPVAQMVMWHMFANTRAFTTMATDSLSGIDKVEFFVDTDPGQGNGTVMTLSGATYNGTVSTSVSNGMHTLYVRSQDKAGNWSTTASRNFVMLPI